MKKEIKDKLEQIKRNVIFISLNRNYIYKYINEIRKIYNKANKTKTSNRYHKKTIKMIINNYTLILSINGADNTDSVFSLEKYKEFKNAIEFIHEYTILISSIVNILMYDDVENILKNLSDPYEVVENVTELNHILQKYNDLIDELNYFDRRKVKKIFNHKIGNLLPGAVKGPSDIGCTKNSIIYLKIMTNRINEFIDTYLLNMKIQ